MEHRAFVGRQRCAVDLGRPPYTNEVVRRWTAAIAQSDDFIFVTPEYTLWAHYKGGDVDAGLAELEASAGTLIADLLWWTAALKTARASAS